jgi:hypothetical protein
MSIEVVDPDPNAANRLHVVSIAGAAQFCKERPPLRADYFRKMLRGDCDEHRGWMLRSTVAGRWLRHTVTGEYVPVVGKAPRRPGMFTASNYFWLYYAAEGVRGLTKQVGVNEGSGPHGAAAAGEYHAILSNAAAVDADSIAGSNSTYDFTGTDASRPELLYIRTYSCACERY